MYIIYLIIDIYVDIGQIYSKYVLKYIQYAAMCNQCQLCQLYKLSFDLEG